MSCMKISVLRAQMWYSRMIAPELRDESLMTELDNAPYLNLVGEDGICTSPEADQRKVIDLYEHIIKSFEHRVMQYPQARVNFLNVYERMIVDVRNFRVYHPVITQSIPAQRAMTEEEYEQFLDDEWEDWEHTLLSFVRYCERHG
jgi:hypothetical protein